MSNLVLNGSQFYSVVGVATGECNVIVNNNAYIKRLISNIRLDFIELGLYLLKFKGEGQYHYFYDNFSDYVEHELNFNKSTAYNLMAIAERFTFDGTIKPEFSDYSYSQFVELKGLSDQNILDNYPSSLSVSEIKKRKKEQFQSSKDDFQTSGKYINKYHFYCTVDPCSVLVCDNPAIKGVPFKTKIDKIIHDLEISGSYCEIIINVLERSDEDKEI